MAKELLDEISRNDNVDVTKLSPKELKSLKTSRWRARTNLLYLANNVLGKDRISEEFHGGLINKLQKFKKPTEVEFEKNDVFKDGSWIYTPVIPMEQLPGLRRRLILDFRSAGKTTLNCECHTLQWHLNYPMACIAIFQYKLEKAETILKAIKDHYLTNGKFRALFPEYCPPKEKINDFGTKAHFDIWQIDKRRPSPRRERSVMTASLDAGLSGYHFEVMKFSDVVETENTETLDQCLKTIDKFGKAEFLLTGKNYWIDVEGTRYHFGDLYGDILKKIESHKVAGRKFWDVYARGIYVPQLPSGETRQFSVEELAYPDLLDENGKPMYSYPKNLEGIFGDIDMIMQGEIDDPVNFAAQYRNRPIGGRGGVPDFPIVEKNGTYDRPAIMPLRDYKSLPKAFSILSVDFAETVSERANWTVFAHATIDRMGRTYVDTIIREKWQPSESVKELIDYCNALRPTYLVMEEVNFTRGLRVAIEGQWQLNPSNYKPIIRWTKRPTNKEKEERIRLTLQQPYKTGSLRFVKENIDIMAPKSWAALIQEFREFPKSTSDDILDAVSDIYDTRDWFGKEFDKEPYKNYYANIVDDPMAQALFVAAIGNTPLETAPVQNDSSNFMTPDTLFEHFYAQFK